MNTAELEDRCRELESELAYRESELFEARRQVAALEADKRRLITEVMDAKGNAEDDHEYMAGEVARLEAENEALHKEADHWREASPPGRD